MYFRQKYNYVRMTFRSCETIIIYRMMYMASWPNEGSRDVILDVVTVGLKGE